MEKRIGRVERQGPCFPLCVAVGLALAGIVLVLGVAVQPAHATSAADGLDPLPRECGGVNPPGYPVPICCAFGYVYYATDTLIQPLVAEGAVVTLTTSAGWVTTTVTTPGWLSPEGVPYFQFDLDALVVGPGSAITLAASYLDRAVRTTYQVITGGQQVDLVLPEARGFDPITVTVDDKDLSSGPDDPGFFIAGAASLLSEVGCGPGSEFLDDTIYAGSTTSSGVEPATIQATFRPVLPESGTYELFAYAPHGCAAALPQYVIHVPGSEPVTTVVDQAVAGQIQGQWVSLGVFEFPAGTDSYVAVDNVTGQLSPVDIAFDAIKWELRSPFPALATITVDDLDEAASPDDVGFYKEDVAWGEATTECDASLACGPIYWNGHTHYTYAIRYDPPINRAHWRPTLPAAGVYELYTFVPLCNATSRSAQYGVYKDNALFDEVTLDQASQGAVWMPIGSYELPAGTSSFLYLDDVTGENSGDLKRVAFDAARWVLRAPFRPVATIHSIRPSSAIHGEDIITARGGGADTDDDGQGIVAYEWRSNLDGVLATSKKFSIAADALSVGTHTLAFRVQDDEGLWSEPVITHLKIQPPGLTESWHFMLYLAGDNNLSFHLDRALDRLTAVTPPAGVTVTVLFDQPGGSGMRRYLLHPTQAEWVLEEGNCGNPQTLASYVLWAQENYPASHYYLAVADHGRGIQGLAWDDTSSGDYLTLPELGDALQQGTGNGSLKLDVLHLDACLMDMLEVAYEVWPYADYLVASQNLAWALFGYDSYIQALLPETTPRSLAASVAEIYHARVGDSPHTIAALDLGEVGTLAGQADALAEALLATWPAAQPALETALSEVQRFDSRDYGRITGLDEFVDLRHLAELLLLTSDDSAVQAAAQGVISATALSQEGITTTVIYEQHLSGNYGIWWDLEDANGVAIYFPPAADSWDYSAYLSPSLRLGSDTRWDELLHAYLGEPTPGEKPGPPAPLQAWRVHLPLILRRQ